MITFFTSPKSFEGLFDIIQRNAILSWLKSCPSCEIILFGDDRGTSQVADEYGLIHNPKVSRNEFGRPLINSIFTNAVKTATNDILCYINTDIIILPDFPTIVEAFNKKERFLVVGRRWNLDVTESINFEEGSWGDKLRNRARSVGRLFTPDGIDYFVFTPELWDEIPPFAIGRPAWDNWMIYKARSLRVPVIDVTDAVTVIHQNHHYQYQIEEGRRVHPFDSLEARRNLELAGRLSHTFNVLDASHYVKDGDIRSGLLRLNIKTLKHNLELLSVWYDEGLLGYATKTLSSFLYIIEKTYKKGRDKLMNSNNK